ncbi:hypothetical protein Syun_014647 [Stephania yunnanensis]|uniref:B30.2/SPRY domain-containing protein n=1 Tax=Stephania yunnanensis TaxID=152371 RepID=A0AAP0JM27_9MAGN
MDDTLQSQEPIHQALPTTTTTITIEDDDKPIKEEPDADAYPDDLSDDSPQQSDDEDDSEDQNPPKPTTTILSEDEIEDDEDEQQQQQQGGPKKKHKSISSIVPKDPQSTPQPSSIAKTAAAKKAGAKKKSNNVWVSKSTRKGKKKTKSNSGNGNGNNGNVNGGGGEDTVLITPIPRFPDRSDDSPESRICLSKVYKAEKVEISEDRMSAGSSKGYRMVRATRGVVEGAWYFEIRVLKLGESGHTRLGWSTEKGDLQAPVGYDGSSFGYRDIDGSKVHKALREKYGEEGYVEGDVIGCYINLPQGGQYAPKPPNFVWYKGQRYMYAADGKEEPPKVVPGSEISFFKNGLYQGVAFKDLFGGRYYPAASMYTLPNQPNCVVTFNFGPDFEFFPEDFGGRPIPSPMIEVPYHGFDGKVENGESNEKKH